MVTDSAVVVIAKQEDDGVMKLMLFGLDSGRHFPFALPLLENEEVGLKGFGESLCNEAVHPSIGSKDCIKVLIGIGWHGAGFSDLVGLCIQGPGLLPVGILGEPLVALGFNGLCEGRQVL